MRAVRVVMCGVGPAPKGRRARCERGMGAAGSAAQRLIERAGLASGSAGIRAAQARCCRVGPLGMAQETGQGRRRHAVGPHVERGIARQGQPATN